MNTFKISKGYNVDVIGKMSTTVASLMKQARQSLQNKWGLVISFIMILIGIEILVPIFFYICNSSFIICSNF